MQILNVFKHRYVILIWLGLLKIEIATKKCEISSETLLNAFHNFVPHKINKFDYRTPEWINKLIKLSLKRRSKLTKRHHHSLTANNNEALHTQAKERTSLIIESKERCLRDSLKSVQKTYLSIINKLLSNKKLLYHPFLLTVN